MTVDKGTRSTAPDGGPSTKWFVVITVGYLFVVLAGAWNLGYFDSGGTPISPNEWGDVLAGTFSPLAFLWLLYASLSQRAELELQREELRQNNITQGDQRDEMRKQVEAMTAQAKLLEAQAAATFDPLLVIRQIANVTDSYAVTIENKGSEVLNAHFRGDFQVRYYNGGSNGLDEVEKHVYFWEKDGSVSLYFDTEERFIIDKNEKLPSISVQYTRKDGAMKCNVYLLSIVKRSLRLIQSDQIMPSIGHK